jgi:uncharacterized protein (TIGR02001 family)
MKKAILISREKRIALFCVLLLASGSQAFGAGKITTAGSFSYVSSYIWRGTDSLPDNDPAFQPSLTFTHSNGISLNLWGSYGFGGPDETSRLDELDYTLGYTSSKNPAFQWSVGHSYYTFLTDDGTTESQETYVGFSFPEAPLEPNFTLYGDWGHGKGYYANLSGGKDVSLNLWKKAMSLSFSIGYSDGQWDYEPGFSDINLGVSFPFGHEEKPFTLSLNYTYVPRKGSNAEENVPPKINYKNEFWVGLKYDFNL